MAFQFKEYQPPPGLRPILRRSFFAKGRIAYRSDKILPNGLAVAVFNLGRPHRLGKSDRPEDNPRFAHSWMHGVQTTPIHNTPDGRTHVLGLLFEPIGLHALSGCDMSALTDRTLDAREVLPEPLLHAIEARLPRASSEAAHGEIHQALAGHAARALPHWLWSLAATIARCQGLVNLGQAYAAAGRSPRHINARFKMAVGVSPKVLCRIHRLQALLMAIDPGAPVSWTELAHRFEFTDQAHFNREFRAFSGLTPSQYLAQRRRDLSELGKGDSVSFAPQR